MSMIGIQLVGRVIVGRVIVGRVIVTGTKYQNNPRLSRESNLGNEDEDKLIKPRDYVVDRY